MMNIDENDDTVLEAQWVVDSETGVQYLIDIYSGKVLAVRNGDSI